MNRVVSVVDDGKKKMKCCSARQAGRTIDATGYVTKEKNIRTSEIIKTESNTKTEDFRFGRPEHIEKKLCLRREK